MSWDLPLQLALLDITISDISGGVQSVTAQSGLINTGDEVDVVLNNVGVISLGTGQGAKNTGDKTNPVIELDISGGNGISLSGDNPITIDNTGILSLSAGIGLLNIGKDNTPILQTDISNGIGISISGSNPLVISQNNIVGQYYKTASQTAGSGTINVTFNAYTSWTDLSGYIGQTNSTNFTVLKKGIYQLEFLMSNGPNTASWNTNDCVRVMAIAVTRGVTSSYLIPLSQWIHNSPAQSQYGTVSGTLELDVGDVIKCQNVQTVTSGLTSISGALGSTYDFNTSFTWRLIKAL